MENLFDFVSNDYVRTYVSLAGFVISLVNSLYLISVNCLRINLIQRSYAFCENIDRHPVYFEFGIENKSRLQISISRMFLHINKKRYEFRWEKERIGYTSYKSNNEIIESYSTYSLTLPQSISGLGIVGGFFYVETENSISEENFLNSDIYVEIYTNRGKRKFKVIPSKLPVHS